MKLLFIISILLFSSCGKYQNKFSVNPNSLRVFSLLDSTDNYYELKNENMINATAGKDLFKDLPFTIKVPKVLSLKKVGTTIGGGGGIFQHVFNFNSNQSIILISNLNSSLNDFTYSFREFENLSYDLSFLDEINLMKNRYFGLKKYEEQNYYAFFVNVKKSELDDFEFSINSLDF